MTTGRTYTLRKPGPSRPSVGPQMSLSWAVARDKALKDGAWRTRAQREPPGSAALACPSSISSQDAKIDHPQGGTVKVFKQGSLVEIVGVSSGPRQAPEHKRGKVVEWSLKSRFRLKCFLGTLRREDLARAYFLTLTYPAEYPAPDKHSIYKEHLRQINQSFVREWGSSVAGIWKLEFQKRGAAHYHIMLTGLTADVLDKFRVWLASRWFEIVGSGDDKHLRAGTAVEVARSVNGAVSYLAKYISKDDQTRPGDFTGRYWGVFNRVSLPLSSSISQQLGDFEAVKIRRWMRKIAKARVEASRWKRVVETQGKVWSGMSREELQRCGDYMRAHFRRFMILTKTPALIWHDIDSFQVLPNNYYRKKPESRKSNYENFALTEIYTGARAFETFKAPPKYKSRNNRTVRLLCDAGSFWAAVERARGAGLLSRPVSGNPF